MKQLVKDKYDEEYQVATLEIFRDINAPELYNIELRSRGNRRKEVCYYPPIKLKFPKDQYENHTLKWVNVCRNSDLYEEQMFKEYLAYKIFELLSEKSFRSHLVKVEYVDTGRDDKTFTRHAFVLEDADAIAARLDGRKYEPSVLRLNVLDREQLALFTLFQYMIANTDWAFMNRHNIEAIGLRETSEIAVVPYDFDYSGFVNTSYAVPHESLPVKEVTDRYNKGICLEKEECQFAAEKILGKKEEIDRLIADFDLLSDHTRRSMSVYLDDFWYTLEHEKDLLRVFNKNCQEPD